MQQNAAKGRTTLTDGQLLVAGSAAGIANSVVSGPVEHIRIRGFSQLLISDRSSLHANPAGLQTQSATEPLYKGPFDAVRKIAGPHGIAGIYKGQAVTILREATGYAAYFLTYEKLVQREMDKKGIRRDEINLGMSIAYGATAGYAVSSHLAGVQEVSRA